MKKVFAVLAQFLLFLLAFFLGSFVVHPFHLQTALAPAEGRTRSFLWDGVLLMGLLYGLILLLQAARKRLRGAAAATSLALILAGATGWLMKFGYITRDW